MQKNCCVNWSFPHDATYKERQLRAWLCALTVNDCQRVMDCCAGGCLISAMRGRFNLHWSVPMNEFLQRETGDLLLH